MWKFTSSAGYEYCHLEQSFFTRSKCFQFKPYNCLLRLMYMDEMTPHQNNKPQVRSNDMNQNIQLQTHDYQNYR